MGPEIFSGGSYGKRDIKPLFLSMELKFTELYLVVCMERMNNICKFHA